MQFKTCLTFNHRIDILTEASPRSNLARAETGFKTGSTVKTWLAETGRPILIEGGNHLLVSRQLVPLDDVTQFPGISGRTFASTYISQYILFSPV